MNVEKCIDRILMYSRDPKSNSIALINPNSKCIHKQEVGYQYICITQKCIEDYLKIKNEKEIKKYQKIWEEMKND